MDDDRPTGPPALPPLRLSLARIVLRLGAVVAAAIAISWLTDWAMRREAAITSDGPLVSMLLLVLLAVYACLLAIPFVPGIEIGLMLLMLRGAEVAGFVYLATLAGLTLAFLVGRHVPMAWLRGLLLDLRLGRAAEVAAGIETLSPDQRMELLRARLPRLLTRRAFALRYPALAVLVNLPGNGILGGGGGLLMLAGLTGLFRTGPTLLTLALAVAPVPLFVWLVNYAPLSP